MFCRGGDGKASKREGDVLCEFSSKEKWAEGEMTGRKGGIQGSAWLLQP